MDNALLFKTFCIECYRQAHHISGAETFDIFQKFGVFGYLTRHFEVLHTQGENYIIADIDEFIRNSQLAIHN